MQPLTVPTAEAMRELGGRLADLLRPGDVVVLTGDLGAGKTTMVQGIARGLDVPGAVTSPTFVIARVHRGGRHPLVHVDAYRLSSTVEVDDLDLDADVADAVTVIEWGAGLVEGLSEHRLEVRLERSGADGDETRQVTIVPVGDRWSGWSSATMTG